MKVQQGKPGETTPIQYRYFKYDSLGRLIRVMQPEQEPNPNLALADPYNTSGQWSAAFKYNALGDLVRATDANGVSIISEYDKAKRVTKRCYSKPNLNITATTCAGLASNEISDNTPEVTFLYDGLLEPGQTPPSPDYAKGKLTRVSSSVSDTRYTQFDTLGRLTEMRQITDGVTYASQYQYNFAGSLVQETYPSGRTVRNEFESDGDLSRIWGKAGESAPERTYANSFSYTADGKIERLKLGNNRWEWAKFNERLQVTELNLGAGVVDASLWKLTYHYGELNSDGRTVDAAKNTANIAMQTVSFAGQALPFVQTYRYDSLYRITEARETNGSAADASQNWKETFGYDRFGNRTGFAKFSGTTELALDNRTFPSIDPNTNRFNANQGYLYDKNGNLIADAEGRSFVFNGENKQSKIIKDGKLVGEYDYNGEGQRVKKRTYDANGYLKDSTVFVYSAGKLVAEYSTAAPPENPTTRYTATDMLGSPRVITDSQGYVIARRDFKPFGEEITSNTGERTIAAKYGISDNLRQKFTTYQRDDETGLDFAEARMYENRHGRFTAVDPLLASGKSANPQTFNRFVYVEKLTDHCG
ncbi:MAG: RHS repeat protein [Acidobacteria bacterium]|nr:RHS repeat protein [Acidobacteriota bacterium]